MSRILYVCHSHPELVPGGTELFAHDLFRAVRDQGKAEAMFLGCVSRLHRPTRPEVGFQTIGRSKDELLLWVGGFDRFMLGHTETAPFVQSLTELLTAFRPDVVHFHHFALIGLEALALTRRVLPQTRIVATLHDYHPICANDGLMVTTAGVLCDRASPDACHACLPDMAQHRFATRGLHVRNMLQLVDRFIAPSRFLKERFVAWGIAADRIDVIANGLPEMAAAPAAKRPRQTFGVFGSVAPHKGAVLALSAIGRLAERLPGVSLRVHGGLNFPDEAFRRNFETTLCEAGDAAVHCGPYRRDELPALMAEIDWIVVPSTWWENAPLVILEAFRHKRPVICSGIGGMAELVADGVSGLHFRTGDLGALVRTMRRAVEEDGLWDRLVGGIPDVPTMTETVKQHMGLYSDLLQRREARSA
ncbi:MAG TPA: glycosyltransferase family 4 protein [Alphaproteobacteria bacterium]|nr:glycosyltransferase family 4 protein [Alphaproteobacteria bacterium]